MIMFLLHYFGSDERTSFLNIAMIPHTISPKPTIAEIDNGRLLANRRSSNGATHATIAIAAVSEAIWDQVPTFADIRHAQVRMTHTASAPMAYQLSASATLRPHETAIAVMAPT
jgi:hypothetical protein